jgi:hypothetical protein
MIGGAGRLSRTTSPVLFRFDRKGMFRRDLKRPQLPG